MPEQQAHDKETCLEEERWLHDDDVESELVEGGESITVKYECPKCGREWEYVHPLFGLWNPRAEKYEWTN